MRFETKKGLEFFFKNFETKYPNLFPSLLAFSSLIFCFWCLKKKLILEFAFPIT